MAHSFRARDILPFLPMMLIGAQQLANALTRGKIKRLEQRAAAWPVADGRVRGGAVSLVPYGGFRLTLTFDAFSNGHGIGLQKHVFLRKAEAEHARDVLTGQACRVHWNPADTGETALLWSELQPLLARKPYVPRPARLGRAGYRWLGVFAALTGVGFAASVTVDALASANCSACVCDWMIGLLFASVVLLVPAIAVMATILAEERRGALARVRLLFANWYGAVLACTALAAVASLMHYGPVFRALAADADVPDRVMAGTLGALLVPLYWFAFSIAVQGLHRLKPVDVEAAVPAAV